MSDVEEPPTKVSKIEDPPTPEALEALGTEDDNAMEEGQEEWLSEEVLTDDDFNPNLEQDKNDSNFGSISQISQDENLPINDLIERLDSSINTDPEEEEEKEVPKSTQEEEKEVQAQDVQEDTPSKDIKDSQEEIKNGEQTIEETLNNLEGSKEVDSEDTEYFVLRKNDSNLTQEKTSDEVKVDKSEDDGNDTDDLLRMLGDGDNRSKKKVMKLSTDTKTKDDRSSDDDDDDGFVYDDAKMESVKVSKFDVMKKYAAKAEPENMSDGDDENDLSSDETNAIQKMFGVKSKRNNYASKSTAKSSGGSQKRQSLLKRVVDVANPKIGIKTQQSLSKQYHNKSVLGTMLPTNKQKVMNSQKKAVTSKAEGSFIKSDLKNKKSELITSKSSSSDSKSELSISKSASSTSKSELGIPKSASSTSKREQKSELGIQKSDSRMSKFDALKLEMSKMKEESEEIIDGEEFLEDEEDFELDEDEFAEESDMEEPSKKQKLMKPESMDEEVPSDEESRSEDGSLYDELPSSESEELDDWFKLDIRAERATDYLPFLGSKARELLLEEKRRVGCRLQTLRQSLTALTDSARVQAEEIRDATMTLAELDDMLKAT